MSGPDHVAGAELSRHGRGLLHGRPSHVHHHKRHAGVQVRVGVDVYDVLIVLGGAAKWASDQVAIQQPIVDLIKFLTPKLQSTPPM